MSSLFQQILGWILVYKYPTLFLVTFLSCLGIPLPAGSSLIASAAFASQGYLNVVAVLLIAFGGSLIGDATLYVLVRRYGHRVLRWLRLEKLVESVALKNVEGVENTFKAVVIVASRFQDQATTIVNVIAGLGRIPFKRFVSYTVLGEILQTCFYGSIGYFFADNWQSIYSAVGQFSWLIVLGTLIVTLLMSKKLAKHILK